MAFVPSQTIGFPGNAAFPWSKKYNFLPGSELFLFSSFLRAYLEVGLPFFLLGAPKNILMFDVGISCYFRWCLLEVKGKWYPRGEEGLHQRCDAYLCRNFENFSSKKVDSILGLWFKGKATQLMYRDAVIPNKTVKISHWSLERRKNKAKCWNKNSSNSADSVRPDWGGWGGGGCMHCVTHV